MFSKVTAAILIGASAVAAAPAPARVFTTVIATVTATVDPQVAAAAAPVATRSVVPAAPPVVSSVVAAPVVSSSKAAVPVVSSSKAAVPVVSSSKAAVPVVPSSTAAAPVKPSSVPGAPASGAGGSISVTPHDVYGSSIGVLGCHVNVNRIAYWPTFPGCDNLCKKVTSNGRSVYLLHIDQSGGAHDISYDAWNYLNSGASAMENPTMGGGIPATWEDAPMSACADIIKTPDGKLPLSASNAMNTWAGCPAGSYVHEQSSLWNVLNPNACTFGYNERCTIDLAVSNQAKCPHTLGANNALTGVPVENIQYGKATKATALQ